VDLISGKAFGFAGAEGFAGGENIEKEIEAPQEMLDLINKYRTELIEAVAETDEALLEKYLSEGSLNSDELIMALKKAILNREIIPVFCGAVYGGYGSSLLLNSLLQLFPSPDQRNGQTANKISSNEQVIRKCSDNEPFSAIVFKNISEAKAGEFIYFKSFSGVISQGVDIFNVNHSQTERMGQIIIFQGKERFEVPRLHAGDIAATTKLRRTLVGDTLCDIKDQIMLSSINFPLPVVSMALKPKSQKDQEKLSVGLMKFAEIDPTFKVAVDHEFGETVISAMGELHIDVIVERIKSRYGVEFDLDKPKVPYRETIKGKTEVQGKYKKQSGGRGQYGDVWLRLEPLPRGKGYEFVDEVVGGVIPSKYIPAVEKGVKESMNRGVLAGYPCVDMKVSLFDGTYHTVDSSDIAFQIAASMAFRKAMEEAKPVLLEPIMTVEVTVPSEYMGEINGDLNSRHGRVLGMEAESKELQKVKAQVPLAQLHRYSTDIRSMTQGKGYHTMEFSHYEEVPAFLAEKVIAEAKKAKEEKEQKS
jgi:elongation factor G